MTNFRKFTTSSGLQVFGGKSSENNDELVLEAKPRDVILHTSAPGSPFVNVGESPSTKDINESAVFCAKYSQEWRNTKSDVIINKFLRSDMNKTRKMKSGSWRVKRQKKIRVKRTDILKFEELIKNEADKKIAIG